MISQTKIQKEKERIVKNCKSCNGVGCSSCASYCTYVDKMVEAGIPVDYWHRKINDFYGEENFKEFLFSYIDNLDNEYLDGKTLCFSGHRGTGKTMAACAILKKAIVKHYTVHYTTMVDVVTILLTDEASCYRDLIKHVDFMVVDEVDQRFFPSINSQELYGNHFEYILRTRSQNKLPTIMCTNSENIDDIFAGQFKESLDSLRSQFIKVMRVGGKDARKEKEKL